VEESRDKQIVPENIGYLCQRCFRSFILWDLLVVLKPTWKKKESNHSVPGAAPTNCIPKALLFASELGLPLVEVEVCLWELGDEQVSSLVPITKMWFKCC